MAWFWTLPPDENGKDLPFAQYDHRSRIPSYEVTGTKILNQNSADDIVLFLPRKTTPSLLKLHCIPSSSQCPLVDPSLEKIIVGFSGGDTQGMPVLIMTKDSELKGYSFVRPLIEVGCVDVEKSTIEDWLFPGERILNATRLALREDCLNGKHFVRDSFTSHVIVSDELKEALMATGDKGLYFRKPEDMTI